jgi:hypothetical protein
MAKDKPGIVAKDNWHMAKLHPAFGFPAHLLDFFRPEVFGGDDRGGAVIFLQTAVGN